MENGKDVIVSDTNLNTGRRNDLISSLKARGYDVEIKDFPVSYEEAVKRDLVRPNSVGSDVIAKQWKQWNEYIGLQQYTPVDPRYTKCVIVDIDGTIAHRGDRGAFVWDKVHLDTIDYAVKMIINNLPETVIVIALSGRDGCCYDATAKWLDDNDVRVDHLLMRAAGDMRKDSIIKAEIFWKDIAPKYNVIFAIDDRPSIVNLWNDIGVKVFAVGDQRISF